MMRTVEEVMGPFAPLESLTIALYAFPCGTNIQIYVLFARRRAILQNTSSSNCLDRDFSIKSEIYENNNIKWITPTIYRNLRKNLLKNVVPFNGTLRSNAAADETMALYLMNSCCTHGCCLSSSISLSSFWQGFFKNDMQSICIIVSSFTSLFADVSKLNLNFFSGGFDSGDVNLYSFLYSNAI